MQAVILSKSAGISQIPLNIATQQEGTCQGDIQIISATLTTHPETMADWELLMVTKLMFLSNSLGVLA